MDDPSSPVLALQLADVEHPGAMMTPHRHSHSRTQHSWLPSLLCCLVSKLVGMGDLEVGGGEAYAVLVKPGREAVIEFH
jgi:hypothetical protein